MQLQHRLAFQQAVRDVALVFEAYLPRGTLLRYRDGDGDSQEDEDEG